MLAITPDDSPRTRSLALLVALAAHLAFIALAARWSHAAPAARPLPVSQMFEIEAPPLVEPKPAPAPEPAPSAAAPRAASRATPRPTPRAAPTPSPPSPAPAAPRAPEVLDFGATLLTGASASSFSATRGVSNGSASGSRGAPASASGTGTGTSDLSRAPALAGATEWRCPFPPEADTASIDHAVVTLRLDIASTGRALSAHALDDPGHGFAHSARSCALKKRFVPALDRQGRAVRATATIQVTFDR